MSVGTGDVVSGGRARLPERQRVVWLASIVFFGALPLYALGVMFYDAVRVDGVAFDFRVFFVAAEAALRGDTIYPPVDDPTLLDGRAYVYPPLTAIAVTPLTLLPMEAAGLIVMVLLVAAALAIPLVLGVRDWRCFGMVLLWPPVISAIQTANVSIFLALAAALVWRYRDRPAPSGLALGLALAMKLLLWPVAVWQALTRRFAAVLWAMSSAVVLVFGSWAVVGFDGFGTYPELLRRLSRVMDDRGYTVYALALEYGVPSSAARVLWIAVAATLLGGIVLAARRGDQRSAFIVAIAASLACTPVVWLHYLTLLLVVVALAQRSLGLVWFVPIALFVTPGSGNPTPFETTATIAVAVATIVLALRASRRARSVELVGCLRSDLEPAL
ncbi:MAG: DUF2029 domain-containing protein [Thermoleophilia bacterium]|nr:DUF2029 domain-containing protein [Thermoleophilia bacterium]MDH4339848.1 DUF2029 domain-containing protein [Thermoleophilia bacterium]